nr:hypothetical protein [uncultured Faecalibacillus sp.]
MSKYDLLWKYIRQKNCDSLLLSFNLIYDILGFEIDHSFLTYKKELKDDGYYVKKISMKNKTILVERKQENEI